MIPVFDIHTHPSLKTYLTSKRLYRRYRFRPRRIFNPFTLRTNLPNMRRGHVRSIMATLYAPERELFDDCAILDRWARRTGRIWVPFREARAGRHNDLTWKMYHNQEKAVFEARRRGWPVFIAKSLDEWQQGWDDPRKPYIFLHTIEGAHSLGGDINELYKFFDAGCCLMTLAHLYENEAVQTAGGIPEDYKNCNCFKNNKPQFGGLSDFGKQVVEEMFRIGMLIDLTHATQLASDQVFSLNKSKSPVIMSHRGVQALNNHPMNASDDDLRKLAECGGVLGVIFMNYWLKAGSKDRKGIDYIVDTIRHVQKVAGIESVAIGTDFDGFTNTPNDALDHSHMPRVANAMVQAGFREDEIERVFYKNAKRVLEAGWKKAA